MSSGTVSRRTRMTGFPCCDHSTAVSAENTTCPLAAPGDAGSPVVTVGIAFHSVGVESRRQQLIERFRIDQQNRVLRRHELLGRQIGGDHHRRVAGALAAARLQHEQPLVLNRELEVLHVLVVALEPGRDLAQLLVRLRQHLLQLANRLRCAHARHDVLALGVDQELAVELFLAGPGIPREADAGRRALARCCRRPSSGR